MHEQQRRGLEGHRRGQGPLQWHTTQGHLSLSSKSFTVRRVTALQLSSERAARQAAWLQYACSAVSLASTSLPAPDPSPQANHLIQDLPSRINEVWRLRWDNKWKEIWWRLLLHGVPGAGGHGIAWARGSACACGWRAANAAGCEVRALQQREHVFWTCPHAQAVVDVLVENLPPGTTVLPKHVWLLVPPCPNMNERVWWVVCLCSLNSVRKLRYDLSQDLKEQAQVFLVEGLKDFIACQGGQSPLANALRQDHPFIASDQNSNLVLRLAS